MKKQTQTIDNHIYLAAYPDALDARAAKTAVKDLIMTLRLSTMPSLCTKVAVITKNAKCKIRITEYDGENNNNDDTCQPAAATDYFHLPVVVILLGVIVDGLGAAFIAALQTSLRVLVLGSIIGMSVGFVAWGLFGFNLGAKNVNPCGGNLVSRSVISSFSSTTTVENIPVKSTNHFNAVLADCLEPESSLLVAFLGEGKLAMKKSEIQKVYSELISDASCNSLRTAVIRLR